MIKAEEGGRTVADADIFDLSQAVAPHIIGQHNNKASFFDYDEQRLRDELIEKATARLQRRMLEERLSNVMRDVIQMQSQLEFLRVDTTATIDVVAKMDDNDQQACRLEALERRLQTHQDQLDKLKKTAAVAAASARAAAPFRSSATTTNNNIDLSSSHAATSDPNTTATPSPTTSTFSMSRLSSFSLMSSLFSRAGSTAASSSCTSQQDEDDDCCSVASFMTEEQQRTLRMRRVRQRQQQQQHQQQQQKKKKQSLPPRPSLYPSTTTVGPVPTTIVHSSPINSNYLHYQGGGGGKFDYRDDAGCEDYGYDEDNNSCMLSDIGSLSSSASTLSRPRALYEIVPAFAERFFPSQSISPLSQTGIDLDERNVLDDALSFLDSLSENADDGGFGEDMDLLLRHPELCCRPLSEIRGAMTEIRRRESACDQTLVPASAGSSDIDGSGKGTAIYQWTSSACAYSWKWYKFLSILTAAVTISVLKGPDDMLDEPVRH